MSLVRRHLRRGAFAWLVCHALTFTALVPRDCCAAHAHAAAGHHATAEAAPEAPPCHEMAEAPASAPAPGAHCEMDAADGAACPMHQSGAAAAGCTMAGVCHAPDAALAAVLLQSAVLVPVTAHVPVDLVATIARPPDESARSRAVAPDSPPPRL